MKYKFDISPYPEGDVCHTAVKIGLRRVDLEKNVLKEYFCFQVFVAHYKTGMEKEVQEEAFEYYRFCMDEWKLLEDQNEV